MPINQSSIPIRVRDKWFRVASVLAPALATLYFVARYQESLPVKLGRMVIYTGVIIGITEGSRYIVYNGRRWVKGFGRILLTLVAGLSWISVILTIGVLLANLIAIGRIDWTIFNGSSITINHRSIAMGGVAGFAFLSSIFIFPVLWTFYEILYHFARLRNIEYEKEALEKAKLKAELQQLKGIVNPHFLFNNLNSLSALIAEDPEQAQEFLDSLTRVFRYLLRNNDVELTTLDQELNFIESYFNLLQIRYGDAIRMKIDVPPQMRSMSLPPLTLQLLVENAVKHNRLHRDEALQIELVPAGSHQLTIRNNILERQGLVESTGIGLQSINARYRMLSQPNIIVEKGPTRFCVTISLIGTADG